MAPVLLIRFAPDLRISFPFKNVLVPLDARPGHSDAIPHAMAIAEACHAHMHLVTVVPTVGTLGGEQAATAELLPSASRVVLELEERELAERLQRQLTQVRTRCLRRTRA